MMPGMEGPDVCQRVREHPERPYVYILLLTARNQKDDILLGLESGADDYLTKPFNAQEFRARLHVGQRILNLQDSLILAKEELLFRATHDGLTGISNRGVALEALNREHSRQLREGGSFGIILAGPRSFQIHQRQIWASGRGRCSKRSRVPHDLLRLALTTQRAAYGGEEFLIVVPSSGRSARWVWRRECAKRSRPPIRYGFGAINVHR